MILSTPCHDIVTTLSRTPHITLGHWRHAALQDPGQTIGVTLVTRQGAGSLAGGEIMHICTFEENSGLISDNTKHCHQQMMLIDVDSFKSIAASYKFSPLSLLPAVYCVCVLWNVQLYQYRVTVLSCIYQSNTIWSLNQKCVWVSKYNKNASVWPWLKTRWYEASCLQQSGRNSPSQLSNILLVYWLTIIMARPKNIFVWTRIF